MFRSLFLAIGITLCILGLEFMVVDKVVLADEKPATTAANATLGGDKPAGQTAREFEPPEWLPWSLMSAGAIIIIYSFTIPRRVSG